MLPRFLIPSATSGEGGLTVRALKEGDREEPDLLRVRRDKRKRSCNFS